MTEEQHKCQSYEPGQQVCRDGFPVNAACFGARCHACGAWAAQINPPACMREDFAPKHLIDDAGMPRLAAHQRLHAPTTQDTSPAEANAKDEQAERQRATGHHEDSAPANRVVRKEGNDG
ncbi:hypothetical protein [Thioclava sp. GXIMD4215]|uniref:hypothetical protein n=1 Tax=Thioclava sp. GXIMD4215 TaxID=3131928 RepID=UPI003248747E